MRVRYLLGSSALCLPLIAGCSALQDAPPVSDVSAASSTRNITVYLGQRSLNEDDFAPVEDQPMLGVEYVTQSPGAAVGWEFGLQFSADDETIFIPAPIEIEASTIELYAGVRKTFNQQADFKPYVGGGLSLLTVDLESPGLVQDDDAVIGLYVHAGLSYSITQSFAIGLDYRLLFAEDVVLFDVEGDSNYGQFALTLGFGF